MAKRASSRQSRPANDSDALVYDPSAIEEEFLALWPHRFDFLHAPFPDYPNHSPTWATERRYPLQDRRILAKEYLYGVRFGPQTSYIMLDIDRSSFYHPANDPLAIDRIKEVLEPIGLQHCIIVTSSYREGLHIYFPFDRPQKSWFISQVVTHLLDISGFVLQSGQLEIFPNPREYAPRLSLYHGHRLPLQIGSYMLNGDFQPIHSSQGAFVQAWRCAERHNDLNPRQLKRIHKARQRRYSKLLQSRGASSFLADLEAQIENGWTGRGQTNAILSVISRIGYIFHHAIYGGEPLQGEDLARYIVKIAKSLPGYRDYCGHQHEIFKRATHWARVIEACPRYYPYRFPHIKTRKERIAAAKQEAERSLLAENPTFDDPLYLLPTAKYCPQEEAEGAELAIPTEGAQQAATLSITEVVQQTDSDAASEVAQATEEDQQTDSDAASKVAQATEEDQQTDSDAASEVAQATTKKSRNRKPSKPRKQTKPNSQNIKLAEDAKQRIIREVARLVREDKFPSGISARHSLLVEGCRTSVQTLYRNRDLWHPDDCEIISFVRKPDPTPDPTLTPVPEEPLQAEIVETSSQSDPQNNPLEPSSDAALHDSLSNKCIHASPIAGTATSAFLGLFLVLVSFFNSFFPVRSVPEPFYPGSSSFAFPIVQVEFQQRSTINHQQTVIENALDRNNSNGFQRSKPQKLGSETFSRKILDSGG